MSHRARKYFMCPHCGENWNVTDVEIGETFECGQCHSKFPVTEKKFMGWRARVFDEKIETVEEAYERGRKEERERILRMLKSFECVPGKRADAKSAFQLATIIESNLAEADAKTGEKE